MSAYKNVSRNIYYKDYTFISDANSLPRSAVLGLNKFRIEYICYSEGWSRRRARGTGSG